MPTLPDLFERLGDHGEHAGADVVVARAIAAAHAPRFVPLPVETTPRTGGRRLPRSTRVLTAAAVILALVAVPIAINRAGSGSGSHNSRPPIGPPYPPVASATAVELARFHWSNIAEAPIQLDASTQVMAWAGNEVIVFGEDHRHEDPHGAGAAYSPVTNGWRLLPRAPLSGEWFFPVSWAWTGTELIVFPATVADTAQQRGEAYSPRTNTWRILAPAPLCTVPQPGIVWTGRALVVAGGYNITGSRCSPARVALSASYDPQTDRWTPGPPLPVRAGDRVEGTDLLRADGRVIAIVASQRANLYGSTTPITTPSTAAAARPGTSTTEPIVRVYSWQPGAAAWEAVDHVETDSFQVMTNRRWLPYANGSTIVFPPAQPFCGEGSQVACIAVGVEAGRVYNLAAAQLVSLPLPSSIRANGLDTTAFSGAALIATTHDDASHVRAFAWDTATGRRIELAAPPVTVLGLVWTGREVVAMALRSNSGPLIGLRLGP